VPNEMRPNIYRAVLAAAINNKTTRTLQMDFTYSAWTVLL